MDIDLDPLDDIFGDEAKKNARPVGKFQPKTKFRPPPKKSSAAAPAASSQPVQTIDTARSELSEPVTTANQSKHDDRCSSGSGCLSHEIDPTKCSSMNSLSFSDEVPNGNGVVHATVGKSAEANSDITTGLEALGGSSPQPTTTDTGNVPTSELVIADVANPENPADIYPLTAGEPTTSIGGVRLDNTCLGREEMDVMDSINMSELTTQSGLTTRKFQPKPKIQMQEEMLRFSDPVSCSLGSQSVAPDSSVTEKDPNHIQQDDVLDLLDLGFSPNLPTEEHYDLPLNEESLNVMEMTQSDSGIRLGGTPEIPAKFTSRRAKTGPSKTDTASDPSPILQEAPTSIQENETGRSLRPRKGKTNFSELVDEDDDDVLASESVSEQGPVGSALEDENGINEESQEENESQTKKVKRKSKKSHDVEEKTAKKRKIAKDASNQDKDAKPKKFSHSTRRRRVNKTLLETPEDEIDYQKLPLRDLILLAEYKERQAKKEEAAAAAAVPTTNQSNANPSDDYNEDENFTSRQDGEYDDGQETAEVEDSTVFFNYQTYMDKTPKARWSKQDTELFYEAVRQFGTDLSMIQQLFPERSRRQVKLKYKKEERQHPFRLNEALTNFSKEDFHFQTVIKRLKKMAEEKQKADQDESIDLTGDEVADEGTTSNADVEEAKGKREDERVEEEKNEDLGNDTVQVQDPLESDDLEDDLLIWSQYKSDT